MINTRNWYRNWLERKTWARNFKWVKNSDPYKNQKAGSETTRYISEKYYFYASRASLNLEEGTGLITGYRGFNDGYFNSIFGKKRPYRGNKGIRGVE